MQTVECAKNPVYFEALQLLLFRGGAEVFLKHCMKRNLLENAKIITMNTLLNYFKKSACKWMCKNNTILK